MSSISFFYGVLTILFWSFLSFFYSYISLSKFWKKHIKFSKNIYFLFSILILVFFWISFEEALSESVLQWFLVFHFLFFITYSFWTARKIYKDFKRIEQAEARRKS